jgi:hypothetical protein
VLWAGWPTIGTLKVWGGGIPAHLATGGAIDLTVYYSQDSPDTLIPWTFAVSLWNTSAPGDVVVNTISASWLNPATQAWQDSTNVGDNGTWTLNLPDAQRPKVAPNTTASVRVRLTFAAAARPGIYRLQLMPGVGQSLQTPQGTPDEAILNSRWPQYDIPYGNATAPASPHPTKATSTGRAAPPPAASAAAPSPSDPPSPSPSIAVASPSGSTAPAVVELTSHTIHRSPAWPYLAVSGPVVLLAAAGGYLLWRRRTARVATPES